MTTEEILLTIIKNKGSCDSICKNSRMYCHNCRYNLLVDDDKNNQYCDFQDASDDVVYQQAIKDYIILYKDEIKLFEALL